MSAFWKAIFNKLDIIMITSIAYYSQTDEQSKRINQIVEIVLHFHLITDINDWLFILSFLQRFLNNFITSTNFIFNELTYDFRVKDIVKLLADLSIKNFD